MSRTTRRKNYHNTSAYVEKDVKVINGVLHSRWYRDDSYHPLFDKNHRHLTVDQYKKKAIKWIHYDGLTGFNAPKWFKVTLNRKHRHSINQQVRTIDEPILDESAMSANRLWF